MRIGVFLLAAGFPGISPEQTLRTALDYGIAAEDAGFDDVFMAEHHFMPYGTCPSALTFAALLAGRTRRIGIGTAVTVLSTAHPVAVAEQAAILDVLTGGRFTLGVGRGGPWVDLEVFGSGMEGLSHRSFAEGLDVLCAWGSQDSVSYDGEFHRFREVAVVPRGRPRVLVACTSPETAGMAAARGLPILLGMHVDDAEKAAMVRAYGNASAPHASAPLASAPHASAPHASVVVAQVAESRTAGARLLRQTMPPWLRPGLAGYVRFDGTTPPMRDADEYAEHLTTIHPVGPASYCADRIREAGRATGIEHFLLFVEGGGPDHTLDNIKALGDSVLPLLRGAGAGARPPRPGKEKPVASSAPWDATGDSQVLRPRFERPHQPVKSVRLIPRPNRPHQLRGPAAQQSRSSGDWFRSWDRIEVNVL